VDTIPLGRGKIFESVFVRAAATLRFCEQRVVVFLGGGEFVGTDDGFLRQVLVAEAPGTVGRIVRQRWWKQNALLHFSGERAVAAEIAWIAPQLLVGIEVGTVEQIARQRFERRVGVRKA